MESQLGFKFQPSDQLIIHFLKEKRLDPHFSHHPIKDIGHICSLEPWDLAMESKTETEDQVWYFFYEPYYKYRESNRAHRKTEAGHWTITSRDSKIEARNGLTGTKKFLTFYRRSPCSKAAAKTDWIMHEYHVKDDPSYEKEFVLCRIQRKRNKRRKDGISTIDEGEPSEQLVSPPQQSPSHSISNGYHSEQNTHTIPQPQLQNHRSISFPTVQNTIYQSIRNDTPTQLSVSNHSISKRDHNGENIPANQPLPQNHSKETTLKYPPQPPNHNSISYLGNRVEQNMYPLTNNLVIPNYPPTQQPQSDYNMISHFGNPIKENSLTNPQLPPNSNLDSQLPPGHHSVTHDFAGNNFHEERLPFREIKSFGGYNRPNDASSSAVQTPISQEQELNYSNSSIGNCDISDCQIFSDEQVNNLINSLRALLDENSREETGKTLTPTLTHQRLMAKL
ncbi:NAC domain-containing protein [Citrus sinensis]|uniref:NAC domain-containing protein n=2 Tax=Citrus sinensis TaxID=2711 RepID=A0ACB8JHX4_CITSI|nr:NAC domain-containing protein [Citrus sinensis]KAH9717391.1 NAC domain-containing protein [Citrus sinensis]